MIIINKLDVLKSIKEIDLLPELGMADMRMVEKYFNAHRYDINCIKTKYSNKLTKLGCRTVSGSELVEHGYQNVEGHKVKYYYGNYTTSVSCNTKTLYGVTPEGFVLFAENLRDNEIAREFMRRCSDYKNNEESEVKNVVGEVVSNNVVNQTDNIVSDLASMNQLDDKIKVFSNPEFGSVRVVVMDGEPWFVGKDVAEVLGYVKPENAIYNHVDIEDKTTTLIQGTGSNYKSKAVIINESGLYSLILSSKLPSSKQFKRWVTSEVIPSIRKHGAYLTTDTVLAFVKNPDNMVHLLEVIYEERVKNIELTNKNEFLENENSILARDNMTWGNREILNRIIRKIAFWLYPGRPSTDAIKFAWGSLYKDVLYKYNFNLKGRLDKATPDQLMKAVSVAVSKCKENGIDIEDIIGKTNTEVVLGRMAQLEAATA